MAKVETYVEVTMKMSLTEARELHKDLGQSSYQPTFAIFDALDDALKLVKGVEVTED